MKYQTLVSQQTTILLPDNERSKVECRTKWNLRSKRRNISWFFCRRGLQAICCTSGVHRNGLSDLANVPTTNTHTNKQNQRQALNVTQSNKNKSELLFSPISFLLTNLLDKFLEPILEGSFPTGQGCCSNKTLPTWQATGLSVCVCSASHQIAVESNHHHKTDRYYRSSVKKCLAISQSTDCTFKAFHVASLSTPSSSVKRDNNTSPPSSAVLRCVRCRWGT